MSDVEQLQQAICAMYSVPWCPSSPTEIVGIASNVRSAIIPVNGLRHPRTPGTTGWYIWAGEGDVPEAADFFKPVHLSHLFGWRPEIVKFLGLPPGWRFLTDGTYEDVWADATLLDV
jgi:hypothetical protein